MKAARALNLSQLWQSLPPETISVWSEITFLTEPLLACMSVCYSSNSGNSWKAWEAPLERGSYLNSPPILLCSVKSTRYSHRLDEILPRLLLDTTIPCLRCRRELGIWEQLILSKGKISILLETVFQLSYSTSRIAFLSLLSQYLTKVHVISCPVFCTDLAVALGNYGNSNKGVYFETHANGGRH